MAVVLTSCKDETKVAGVTLNPSDIKLAIGETQQLEVIIDPLSAQIYNPRYWSSSDQNVAVVDEKGNVTGVYAGTCTITVSCGEIKATCQVTVETPTYILGFDNSVVFNNGIDKGTGSTIKILRLYDNGLEIDSIGNVSGNGLMMNLYVCSNATTDALIEGVYQMNDSKLPFTILPGEMVSEDGSTYVTGSFLGQYSDNGLSVLLAKTGTMKVTKEGDEYMVECVMEGSLNEHIEAAFSGGITVFRGDTTYQVREINYTNVEMRDTVMEDETSLRHTVLVLECGKEDISMILRLPKSSSEQVMAGRYTVSSDVKSYTIMEGAKFGEMKIVGGTLDVVKDGEEINFVGSFRTNEGAVRVVRDSKGH